MCCRRMTLAELKALVEKMENLPCVISQLEDVQVSSLQLDLSHQREPVTLL